MVVAALDIDNGSGTCFAGAAGLCTSCCVVDRPAATVGTCLCLLTDASRSSFVVESPVAVQLMVDVPVIFFSFPVVEQRHSIPQSLFDKVVNATVIQVVQVERVPPSWRRQACSHGCTRRETRCVQLIVTVMS